MTYAEIEKILSLLDINNHFDFLFATGFLLTIESVLRSGELAGLTWGNINLDTNILLVTNTLLYVNGHTILQESPKTDNSIREVYFSNYIKDILIKLKTISNINKSKLESNYNFFT